MAALDEMNAVADASPGFIWRLQTEEGNATGIQAVPDELTIVNMSVWESVEALSDYVYRSLHRTFLRRKREWFERFGSARVALWWLPAGARPTLADGLSRLDSIERMGPTPYAFTFRRRFDPEELTRAGGQTDRP